MAHLALAVDGTEIRGGLTDLGLIGGRQGRSRQENAHERKCRESSEIEGTHARISTFGSAVGSLNLGRRSRPRRPGERRPGGFPARGLEYAPFRNKPLWPTETPVDSK
jgi:hypothetical protein